MLQIKNISKQYKTGDLVQNALSDVSLNFRDNEFVSILGPSGSGKTTLLNVVGGLDHYDKGDLIINNVSTKRYKDRDWDSYRNHTVGFVFQSYNLIPHQSVLSNVELALTISGLSKRGRKKKAMEALEKVGLKDQMHKKPSQMSGGQMQRVAIARALVNDPDIVLADEPTGALDTETSVQVMDLLKQVANDRLVIMVTHNPELAEKYSTRIVNLKDGKILGDTDPFNPDEQKLEKPKHKNLGKSSMSLLTAFSLSLNNLLTKKGRTILTSFAGSIGIIGIALILSLSTGFQNYIDKIQEDTLTSYPLTVTKETADSSALLLSMVSKNDEDEEDNKGIVKESQVIKDMFSKIGTNDVVSLKQYLSENSSEVDEMVSLIDYKYSVSPLIYTKNKKDEIIQLNPSNLMDSLGRRTWSSASSMLSVFNEMLDSRETLQSQYDVLAGRWPENYDEVILILPDKNGMSDLLLYSLGLRNQSELTDMISAIMKDEEVKNNSEPMQFTYEELMSIPLKLVDATDIYKYNSKYNIYEDMTEDKKFMKDVYDNSIDIKIVGIVTAKEDSTSTNLSTGIGYTKALTEYVINKANESEIVKKQLEDEDINVFNNKTFSDTQKEMGLDFKDMVSIDTNLLSSAFGVNINQGDIANMTKDYMKEIASSITADTSRAEADFQNALKNLTENMLNNYIEQNGKNGMAIINLNDIDNIVNNYLSSTESQAILGELEANYVIPADTFKTMFSELIGGFLKQYIVLMSSAVGTGSQNSSGVAGSMLKRNSALVIDNTKLSKKEITFYANTQNNQLDVNDIDSDNTNTDTNTSESTNTNTNTSTESGNTTNTTISNTTGDNTNTVPSDSTGNVVLGSNTTVNGNVVGATNTVDDNTLNTTVGNITNNTVINPPVIGGNTTGSINNQNTSAVIVSSAIEELVNAFTQQDMIVQTSRTLAEKMTEATMQKTILTKVGELTGNLMKDMATAFNVDESKIAAAFKFNLNEDEMKRLIETMSLGNTVQNASSNLISLGYQEFDEPTSISFYFKDFESKEKFIDFLDEYNKKMEKQDEEKVIKYTDLTGMLMSSVKTVVDSVSYVLIAFVSISLVVSSIMIGIITYISVLERTKEIGILRAIGASKRNVSSIFNAETFIVGFFAGSLGIGITLLLLIPINEIIRTVTGNSGIVAVLPTKAGAILIVLSVVLTLIGGIIPSKHAAKKDPVLALRSE